MTTRRERVRRRRDWERSTQTDRVLTVEAHGHTYRIFDAATKIVQPIRKAGRPYEAALLEHIHDCQFRGVAVDAGANIGNHSLWLAAVCGLRVVAFEPIKHADLHRNIALNGLDGRIRVEPVALGAESTTALHQGKGRLKTGKGGLPVRTLDSFGLGDVTLVKADVEGMEAAVFAGGERTIRRDRPVIFAEEWSLTEHDRIAAVLEPWGYKMTRRFAGKESATPVGRWDPS